MTPETHTKKIQRTHFMILKQSLFRFCATKILLVLFWEFASLQTAPKRTQHNRNSA